MRIRPDPDAKYFSKVYFRGDILLKIKQIIIPFLEILIFLNL